MNPVSFPDKHLESNSVLMRTNQKRIDGNITI